MSSNPPDSSMPGDHNHDGHSDPATLAVILRRPVPGKGKRRIAADLGEAKTHALANHLLATTLEDALSWAGPVVLAPADFHDADWARGLLQRSCEVLPQPEGNLGERINAIDRKVRASGHRNLLYIGSDAPALDDAFFATAVAALATHDVVLGPAEDGGVTLMGARRAWPPLADLPWSTPELGRALERACIEAGMTVARLDKSYDIDFVEDLPRLYADLATDSRPARRKLRQWLGEARLDRPPPILSGPTNTSTRCVAVSAVIPVLDDRESLKKILNGFRSASVGPDEIIVVDASRGDNCASVANEYGCVYMRTRPGRGHQLHTGAMRATGQIVWFLHADAHPPKKAIESIRLAINNGAIGGYFRFRFAVRSNWSQRLLEGLINIRARLGVPYGDQGLFFSRSAYADLGGFPDAPLFEEIPLVKAARCRGKFIAIATPIGVSVRRWERDGWLRRTFENRLLALGFMLGVPAKTLARRYGPKC